MKRVFILLFVEIFYFVISQNVFLYKRCNDEYCMYSDGINRKRIAAINQCYQNQKFLLEVPDLNTGRLLDEFVKHYLNDDDDDVFLNLKGIKSKWHWTGGNEYDNVIAVKDDSEENNFAFIKIDDSDNLHVCASNASTHLNGWICSRNDQCPSPSITIGSECYSARSIGSTWKPFYHAMQDCFLIGATLASFNNMKEELIVEKMKIILETNKYYWFGLTKDVWRWSHSKKVMSYNLFGYGISNPDCLVTYYNHEKGYSEWLSISCSKEVQSICMEKISKSSSGINTSEELNIPLIIGWILAAIFIIAFIILLILYIVKMRNKKIERNPIPRTNTIFQGESNNPPRRSQNLPPDRRSEIDEKIGSTNSYEVPNPVSENDDYTELHA